MDAQRLARYADKLEHAEQRLELAAAWLPQASAEVKDRLPAYKAIQEAA